MPRLLLWQKSTDPICHPRGQDDVPLRQTDVKDVSLSQADVKDLLSQLETQELRNPYFQIARKRLHQGQPMRAIQDCCYPFNLGGRVSRSGHYIKFRVSLTPQSRLSPSTNLRGQNKALRSVRIPATTSTRVVIEDKSRWPKFGFDIRSGSEGMYHLICWLLRKAGMLAATAVERQFKPTRRRRFKASKLSPARQRLAVQVLIKNAVYTTIQL